MDNYRTQVEASPRKNHRPRGASKDNAAAWQAIEEGRYPSVYHESQTLKNGLKMESKSLKARIKNRVNEYINRYYVQIVERSLFAEIKDNEGADELWKLYREMTKDSELTAFTNKEGELIESEYSVSGIKFRFAKAREITPASVAAGFALVQRYWKTVNRREEAEAKKEAKSARKLEAARKALNGLDPDQLAALLESLK